MLCDEDPNGSFWFFVAASPTGRTFDHKDEARVVLGTEPRFAIVSTFSFFALFVRRRSTSR
jgi:hypothetical protein